MECRENGSEWNDEMDPFYHPVAVMREMCAKNKDNPLLVTFSPATFVSVSPSNLLKAIFFPLLDVTEVTMTF